MDNTLCCGYESDAGFIKVIIFFYPASSIQYLRHSGINVRFQNFVFFWFRLVRVRLIIVEIANTHETPGEGRG